MMLLFHPKLNFYLKNYSLFLLGDGADQKKHLSCDRQC